MHDLFAGIRGVLFDVDDTLIDTRGAFTDAMGAMAGEYLPGVPPDRRREVVEMWRTDASGHYRAYTRGELSFREQRIARANELHARFGGDVLDDDAFDAWNEMFDSAFRGASRAFDDTDPLVDTLLAHGYLVGALSNVAVDYQVDKLTRTGLIDRVPMLVGLDTLGFGKPAPEVFLEACERLGTGPGETIYVGDEPDIDARAAIAVGLKGVWLDRPGTRRGASTGAEHPEVARAAARADGVTVVSTLEELRAVLLGAVTARALPAQSR